MKGKDIALKAKDGGTFAGYLATPAAGRGPGVVAIQEIFGVNAGMRAIVEKLADGGYAALCPDLFWRQEPGVQLADKTDAEWARALALYKGFDLERGVADLDAAVETLRKTPGCTGKAGAVGYCLGGKHWNAEGAKLANERTAAFLAQNLR